jgi:hypothetical protein
MRHLSDLVSRRAALAAIAVLGISAGAKASVINIAVQNGSFSTLAVPGTSAQLNSPVSTAIGAPVQQVTGWTSAQTSPGVSGYNFVFSSDATSAGGTYGPSYGRQYGNLSLWSQNTNGTPNGIGPSPDGGNFLGMDGAFEQSSISQVIGGLTVGMDTKVYFYYAGAQQSGFDGVTTEAFEVSLTDNTGGTPSTQTDTTAVLDDTSHGFTGWYYTEVDFVPTATTETLSFLAAGTPAGVPPFSLLDGISIVQVTPEPSTLALLGTGVLVVGGLLRRRRLASRL